MGEGVVTGIVVDVVDGAGLLLKLRGISSRGLVGSHAPALEEIGQVLLRCRAGKAHQVLVRISAQGQGRAVVGRSRRVAGIGVHTGKEASVEQILVVVVDLVLVAGVVGKVKLPVESQLGKDVVGMTLGAAGDLFVDVIV